MYRLLNGLVVLVATIALAGCGSSEGSSGSGSQNEQGSQDQTAQPGEYGSDSYLDDLYDSCESGEDAACEDLYLNSPVGSEYEAFAMEQGGDDFGGYSEQTTQEAEVYDVGEEIELTPVGTEVAPTPVTVSLTSVEKYPELQRDAEYDQPGAEQGPFAVATFEFTNRSEEEYISATGVFNFALQTSQTERQTTSSLSTFEIQPEDKEENADAAPGTTREVVLIFDVEQDEELRYLVFIDQESFEPIARVEL